MKEFLQHRKGVFALLLALFLGMGTAYAYSFSGTCPTGQTLYYNIIDATDHYVEITFPNDDVNNPWVGYTKPTGYLNMGTTVTHNGITYTIKGITWYAFYECTGLTGSLNIPQTATRVGYAAFGYCTGFNGNLSLGSSLVQIDSRAFIGCTGLGGSIIIPNTVTTIGDYAFLNCSGFNGPLTIGTGVTSIGNSAFKQCSGLTRVNFNAINCADVDYNAKPFEGITATTLVIGSSVQRIPAYLFKGCSSFTGSLSIPNSVTEIGDYAFEDCSGFNGTLTLGSSLTTIGQYAFASCDHFTGNLVIPNSVTTLGRDAFAWCDGFNGTLTLSNNLTAIGDFAFYYLSCNGPLTIPNSVTSIGEMAFNYCYNFTSLSLGNHLATIGQYAFANGHSLSGTLTIPASVTSIGKGAFKNDGFTQVNYKAVNCADITTSTQPFEGCTATTLTIGTSVHRIPDYLFFGCTNFTGSLTIPNSVTEIGIGAFRDCSGFTSLTLGSSLTSIGVDAFCACTGLTGDLTIPNSVTTLFNYAFYYCTGFNGTLTIGTGVTSIGKGAFRNNGFAQVKYNATNCADVASDTQPFEACSGILTIGNNVQRIPAFMFVGSSFTGELTIGTGVTSVGQSAFKDCTGFTRVRYNATSCGDAEYMSYPFENCTGGLTIGSNVTRIPGNIFAYADFTGGITIPEAVTTIGYSAFYCCDNMGGYLSLGNSLNTIGIYAFYSCQGLSGSLIIPSSVTKLDMYAFALCSGFTNVTIGSSVNTMNYGAFYSCTGLRSMTVLPETPPTMGNDVFKNVSRDILVYVPCSALEDYQAVAPWNEFELECRPVVTVTAVPTEGGEVYGEGTIGYGEQCTVTASSNSGYLFMHWSKNGDVVSSDAVYSFYVYEDTDLEAVFLPQSSMGTVIGENDSRNENLPSNSFYKYALTEQIYTADELGGSRTINNISFFNAGSTKTRSFDIYIRHTTKTSFTGSTDWVSVNASYKVFSGTVEMRAGQWTTIVLDTPFAYNGTNNLLLVVDDNTGSFLYGMSCRVYDTNETQAIYVRSDNTNYNPASPSSYTGTRLLMKNQIMLNRPEVYNIAATSANTTMGTVSGGGTYGEGDLCRLKATAQSGYTFLNWVDEDGVTVSTDANYTFTVTWDRELTAIFIPAGEYCSLTFDLYDTYGDGWNDNILVVDYEDGTSVMLTVSDDYNETYTLPFSTGSHVDLSWIEGGWSYECYFTVSYEDGDVMYMAMDINEDFEYNFYVDCAGQPEDVTYLGDYSAANNHFLPSYSYYNYALSEQIYTAEEIGAEGFINGMAFYNSGAEETRNYDIYLTTTDKMAFENQSDWISASDAVWVFSGEVTMQADKWTPIKFTVTPFDYDGVSNLVLIVDDNTGDYTEAPHMSCLVYETDSLQAIRVYSDNTDYDPMSPPHSYESNEFPAVMNVKNQVVFGLVPCYEPTELYVTDVTATSAEVSWNSSHHSVFDVQYGLVDPDNDFEEGLGYWTTIDADGDGHGWELATEEPSHLLNLAGHGHNASTDFATSASYINSYGPLTPDNYLVSPRVTLGGSISFWASTQDTVWASDHFGVAVSTTSNTNASDFTTIQEWTMTAKGTGAKVDPETTRSGNRNQGTWYQYTVDLTAYAGQTGYVAIRHFNCTDMFMINVDDITIVQPDYNPAMTTINNVTNTYVSLDDLTPGLQYEVKVRSHCGGAYYSDWVSATFTTSHCTAILVDADNPFFESFEGPDFAPDCWENIPSGNYSWTSSQYHPHTGLHGAYSGYYGDIYLVMPDIELSADAPAAQLSFWSYNSYITDFEVGNNTVVLLNDGTETVLWSAEEVYGTWEKTTIDLSAYLGQTISLAFKYAGYNGDGWYVDDVEVSVTSEGTVTQTTDLTAGWNWFSTYITMDDPAAMIQAIEQSLGDNGLTIVTYDDQAEYLGDDFWIGLEGYELSNGEMILIEVSDDCTVTLEGTVVDPTTVEITLNPGWNYIGFPYATEMNIDDAFSPDFEPEFGDAIASIDGSVEFLGDWTGGDFVTLIPGHGYMYYNASDEVKVLTFTVGAK